MLDAFIEKIAGLARKSAAPAPAPGYDDPRNALYFVDGKAVAFEKPAPPRRHVVGTLDDLVELADRFKAEGKAPVVWYDLAAVTLVIDDDGHRAETATVPLMESDVLATVRSLKGRTFDHKEFVRLLRIDLASAIKPVELLEKVRKVKFSTSDERTSEHRRDRSSMGREITAECKPDADAVLPETVVLKVPAFKPPGPESLHAVECAVEVDAMTGRFQLTPLPDEIERLEKFAVLDVAASLEALDEGIPAYQGKP